MLFYLFIKVQIYKINPFYTLLYRFYNIRSPFFSHLPQRKKVKPNFILSHGSQKQFFAKQRQKTEGRRTILCFPIHKSQINSVDS